MTNIKRLGRYLGQSVNKNHHGNNYDNANSQLPLNDPASLYVENNRKSVVDWDKPLFGNRHTSLQKLLENANKTTERATKFLNKIKLRQASCANRVKSISENATIRKEYVKCGKEICDLKHGPYYYAYWKDSESKS